MYHFPKLSMLDLGLVRSPGAGLGNLLFPIARALLGQARFGGTFVHPTMRQIKIGPIIRRERDLRTYGKIFRGRRPDEWAHWAKAKTLRRVSEVDFGGSPDKVTVTYAGVRHFFHDIYGFREEMVDWIGQNAILKGSMAESYDIGVHIRLGDFRSANSDDQAIRQSFEWYRGAFSRAKQLLGVRAPRTVLFTDEDPRVVSEQVGIPGVEFDPSRNAVTALVNLSKADCIIASRSTFSSWGVFIGNSVAILHADFNNAPFWKTRDGKDFLFQSK